MNDIYAWANRWRIPVDCLRDLQTTLGTYTPPLSNDAPGHGKSEAWVQSVVRLEASQKGVHLFRNNVGALRDENGRQVRYGLANDSKAINEALKSSDLIGWRKFVIEPQHVGFMTARFTCRELKEPGWQYAGDDRERAQLAWINLVNSCGGDAAFATGVGTL